MKRKEWDGRRNEYESKEIHLQEKMTALTRMLPLRPYEHYPVLASKYRPILSVSMQTENTRGETMCQNFKVKRHLRDTHTHIHISTVYPHFTYEHRISLRQSDMHSTSVDRIAGFPWFRLTAAIQAKYPIAHRACDFEDGGAVSHSRSTSAAVKLTADLKTSPIGVEDKWLKASCNTGVGDSTCWKGGREGDIMERTIIILSLPRLCHGLIWMKHKS